MLKIDPYLHFMGTTEDAMKFYQSVFGGEFIIFQRYKDTPGGEKMSLADQDKLIHVSLKVSDTVLIMATDCLESMGQIVKPGDNFHMCIQAESEIGVDRVFNALSAGGKIEMPLNKTFWGAYFGMCVDKFGIQWMINYEYKK